MSIINRLGEKVAVDFDKITERNRDLCTNPKYGRILDFSGKLETVLKVIRHKVKLRFTDNMTSRELDMETCNVCIERITQHIDYEFLAARLCINDLHKRNNYSHYDLVYKLGDRRISKSYLEKLEKIKEHNIINPDYDYLIKYFGFSTLYKSYLYKSEDQQCKNFIDNQIVERPCDMYMRVAISLFDDIDDIKLFYKMISEQKISNATPTLLNAGSHSEQMSSCFQLAPTMKDKLKTAGDASDISILSGGVSIWLHNIFSSGSYIKKSGTYFGGVPSYNEILNKIQTTSGRCGNRPGAFAVYLGVDHADILQFIEQARIKGLMAVDGRNAPDMKYALWVSDLFMRKLEEDLDAYSKNAEPVKWYLFNPMETPDLHLTYGAEYEQLYAKYVDEKRYVAIVSPREIIEAAYITWAQVGHPYVLFKDAINKKSNMKNVAPICSSNLCCEITIPSWGASDVSVFNKFHPDNTKPEYGVCNLAALCLDSFVKDGVFDFDELMTATAIEVRALNRIIDINENPSDECYNSNLRHRPIGIGIMGLADVFARLKLNYDSDAARALARKISATIYYAAVKESCELAKKYGAYSSFAGSPASQGLFQFDLWGLSDGIPDLPWEPLRADMIKYGLRNAYLTAYMPTATTSNIVGQNESFEPFTSNLYTRKTLAGDFTIINKHLIRDLTELGKWPMSKEIIESSGSIQNLDLPQDIKDRYKTSREIHPAAIVDMCVAMAPFVCQSMSMNCYMDAPKLPKLLAFLFRGWRAGLKTGMYYCHFKPAASAQKTAIRSTTCTACVL